LKFQEILTYFGGKSVFAQREPSASPAATPIIPPKK
jgi:hypothetical protein